MVVAFKKKCSNICRLDDAGWSSLAARRAHNPKVVGSNPAPATNLLKDNEAPLGAFFIAKYLAFSCSITSSLTQPVFARNAKHRYGRHQIL